MHAEARAFVEEQANRFGPWDDRLVVEFGSRDVNGGVRDLFAGSEYVGVDIAAGSGVDIVADCATWASPAEVNAVVCCETLEHAERWRAIVANAAANLRSGGVLILTAACDPREPHSAVDGWNLREGEHYGNVDTHTLAQVLSAHFANFAITTLPRGDVQAWAVR